MNTTHCPDCRQPVMEVEGRFGRYLADCSRQYANGARYNRGVHHCAPGVAEAAEQRRFEEDAFLVATMAYECDGVADWDH